MNEKEVQKCVHGQNSHAGIRCCGMLDVGLVCSYVSKDILGQDFGRFGRAIILEMICDTSETVSDCFFRRRVWVEKFDERGWASRMKARTVRSHKGGVIHVGKKVSQEMRRE